MSYTGKLLRAIEREDDRQESIQMGCLQPYDSYIEEQMAIFLEVTRKHYVELTRHKIKHININNKQYPLDYTHSYNVTASYLRERADIPKEDKVFWVLDGNDLLLPKEFQFYLQGGETFYSEAKKLFQNSETHTAPAGLDYPYGHPDFPAC